MWRQGIRERLVKTEWLQCDEDDPKEAHVLSKETHAIYRINAIDSKMRNESKMWKS